MRQSTIETLIKLCALRSKEFTNLKLLEFNDAVVAVLEEVLSELNDLKTEFEDFKKTQKN